MTAAVLQGAPVTTFDVDLWIDLPRREYMRVMNVALSRNYSMKWGAHAPSRASGGAPADRICCSKLLTKK